jgi:hypothetical protein
MARSVRARSRSRTLLTLAALMLAAASALVATTPASAASTFQTQSPRAAGAIKVGSKISAVFPTWKPAPTATGYRWYRDGALISGAKSSTYTPGASDYGHDLWLQIIGSRAGYATATRTKDLGTVAVGDAPKWTVAPKLRGDAMNGGTLVTSNGSWNMTGLSVRYQWLRNGGVVSGATSSSYKLTASDVGTNIAARVIVSKAGYTTASARSQVTGKITQARAAFSGDNMYRVGSQIAAGTYYSTTSQGALCYWERLSGASGSFDDIIANDAGSGQRMITISSSDKYVSFDGCGSWYPISLAGPRLAHIPSNGVYKVGQQVIAGTWQSTSGSGSCYWETLASGSGDFDSIINNDYSTSKNVVVDIPSGAYAFSTSDCGTWTRIG